MTASKIISDSPVRPTAADTELLASAQATALAVRDLYQAAVAAGAGGEPASRASFRLLLITTPTHNRFRRSLVVLHRKPEIAKSSLPTRPTSDLTPWPLLSQHTP